MTGLAMTIAMRTDSSEDWATPVVGLLPARTDTAWFHEHVLRAGAEVRFVRGRVAFDGPSRVVPRAPFPSLVVVWRPATWIGGRA